MSKLDIHNVTLRYRHHVNHKARTAVTKTTSQDQLCLAVTTGDGGEEKEVEGEVEGKDKSWTKKKIDEGKQERRKRKIGDEYKRDFFYLSSSSSSPSFSLSLPSPSSSPLPIFTPSSSPFIPFPSPPPPPPPFQQAWVDHTKKLEFQNVPICKVLRHVFFSSFSHFYFSFSLSFVLSYFFFLLLY